MNRREFFKTTGAGIASIAVFPASSVLATEPTKPIILKKNKTYWKQYFRDTTQEYNLVDMIKDTPKQYGLDAYAALVRKRYSEDTYVQMKKNHTDIQINNLPNKSGCYQVFRMFYNSKPTNTMPEITIKIVSMPIVLEV